MSIAFIVVAVVALLIALSRAAQGKYLGSLLILAGAIVLQFAYAAGAPFSLTAFQGMAAALAVVGAGLSCFE